MEKYYKQFENCIQKEKPFCTNDCPFRVDVLDFQDKMKTGRYNAAYKTLKKSIPFPDIVADLCPQYCGGRCPRGKEDEPVQISLMEKTCVARANRKEPSQYNMPTKNKSIAIIGGGPCGLSCALDLAGKKYKVTVYEKKNKLGGSLWEKAAPELIEEDIKRQFKHEDVEFKTDTEINSVEEVISQGYDAVLVATGKDGNDLGTGDKEDNRYVCKGTAVFAGGGPSGLDIVPAMADGRDMSWDIESYLKTKNLSTYEKHRPTRTVVYTEDMKEMGAVEPTDKGIFTDEEVKAAVDRCIRCQCDRCTVYCDLVEYTKKWPLQMRDDIMSSTMSSDSMIHKTPAVRLINMCTQCGMCEEECPGKVQLGKMIKEARKRLHVQDKTPGAFHQFWLRDMEFANGPYSAIIAPPPGNTVCEYAFFPGCHLGAKDPRYVTESFKWLLSEEPSTGLMLKCCGLPVDWSGNEEAHDGEILKLREEWEKLGRPVLVMACPSCMKHIAEYLPEIKMISLYQMMNEKNIVPKVKTHKKFSVFDPCSVGCDEAIKASVRKLASATGASLSELSSEGGYGCCGFGGLGAVADPKFSSYVAQKRIQMSDDSYIVYCVNCKDIFTDEGKETFHILDMIFDIDETDPTETQRRSNRVALKETLLKEVWKMEMTDKPKENWYKLKLSPSVLEKMKRLRLLEEDICNVLDAGERCGRRTLDKETGMYRCYQQLGNITCWVEYKVRDDIYDIINVYTHRMKIELEGIWNGKKIDADLR